jgi:hypothetical protein
MKSENRNPKAEGSPKSEIRIIFTPEQARPCEAGSGFEFGFLSDFGLRISIFHFVRNLLPPFPK